MNEKRTLEGLKPADLEAVALALFRAGYVVREGKRKDGTKTVRYLEYWRESNC